MAQTSDNLARKHGIRREEMDAYALRSQHATAAAAARGVFREEIVGVEVPKGRTTARVEADDHPRPETTLEGLAALKPAFGKDGLVTAGNASGIVDGAAALVVASREAAAQAGRKPLGRVSCGGGRAARDRGYRPVPASQALPRRGCSFGHGLVEINEALVGPVPGGLRSWPRPREDERQRRAIVGHPFTPPRLLRLYLEPVARGAMARLRLHRRWAGSPIIERVAA
jgi:acetyl-CoA acetyltransferase